MPALKPDIKLGGTFPGMARPCRFGPYTTHTTSSMHTTSSTLAPTPDTKLRTFSTDFNEAQLQDIYEMEKTSLAQGSYGAVTRAKHKLTGVVRAVKSVASKDVDEYFRREVAIMKVMDHSNIVRLHDTFQDHNNTYLVMEYCSGGDLFDHIIDSVHLQETMSAKLMQQLLSAVEYMHINGVCHRDLKPENILLMNKHAVEHGVLKISDFGLSCTFSEGQVLTTKCGSPHYVSPQVLRGKYDQQCDLWSCGVIMYMMLSGELPFNGESDLDLLTKVRMGNFSLAGHVWANVSVKAKELIHLLLKKTPQDRYTAKQSLQHEWLQNTVPAQLEYDV
jgi:calcium-dependent protein kinase